MKYTKEEIAKRRQEIDQALDSHLEPTTRGGDVRVDALKFIDDLIQLSELQARDQKSAHERYEKLLAEERVRYTDEHRELRARVVIAALSRLVSANVLYGDGTRGFARHAVELADAVIDEMTSSKRPESIRLDFFGEDNKTLFFLHYRFDTSDNVSLALPAGITKLEIRK